MIANIIIKNKATYDQQGITINELKKVNFIYGANGSGKTTISSVIKNIENHSECQLFWENEQLMKRIVYNIEFIEENFHQSTEIKGIFTLGRESHEIQDAIKKKNIDINKINDELVRLKETLDQKKSERSDNETQFESSCWKLKTKFDDIFDEAFKGFRASKTKFKEKCKEESRNQEELRTLDELLALSKSIFAANKEKLDMLEKLDETELSIIISNSILTKKVIGKSDIDIAELINKLNISDWVKQGHVYLKDTGDICPFCQQHINKEIQTKLSDYFDESYSNQLDELIQVNDDYNKLVDSIIIKLETLSKYKNDFIDNDDLESKRSVINKIHEHNKNKLLQKIKEPTLAIQLDIIGEIIKINSILDTANFGITRHNEIIENLESEKRKLIKQIWRFIFEEIKDTHKTYAVNDYNLEVAIININSTIKSKIERRSELIVDVEQLEGQITSVIPTINEMNKLLRSFSFTNFKFAEATTKGNYKITRPDGEDAKETLSEGEKTFVTFLYFVHLLQGSNDRSRITEDKIVVIDDPISSLDSNILYIVSSLIRRLIENVKNDLGNIKQVFILTHNIYFHKEISFNKNRSGTNKLSYETFWILRKNNNVSKIQSYDYNPIKTSYELMWQELKNVADRSSNSTQNLIRKIIENYFKIYGNYSDDEILSKFDDQDQVTCRALLSWINDGSHFTNDDLYVECTSDTIHKYLVVFEKIFIVTGHHSHYKMMMGIDEETIQEVTQQRNVS